MVDIVYERQWASIRQIVPAINKSGLLNHFYGGFPAYRYLKAGVPKRALRTFPYPSVWNLFAQKARFPHALYLDEPRRIGNWVARHRDLAPIILCEGTAHRFLFPALKGRPHVRVLMRGSSHPEPYFRLQQRARKEAGFPYSETLPPEIIDEIEKNKLVNFLLAGSDMIRNSYTQRGFPAERAFSCAYGIDPDDYPFTNRKMNAHCVLRIGMVGVIGFRKGLARALRLVEWANKQLISSELHLVGPIVDQEAKAMLAKSSASVILHGVVKGRALVDLYHGFHLVILPSYEDGFGQSVIEAMSTGLPVIVSDDVGAKEAVVNGQNGFILSNFNADEFECQLADALRDPDCLLSMGKAAHQSILVKYTLEHYCTRLSGFLEAVCEAAARL